MGMHLHVRALFTTILGLVFSRLLTEPTHLSCGKSAKLLRFAHPSNTDRLARSTQNSL
jgi:hypothetical protein